MMNSLTLKRKNSTRSSTKRESKEDSKLLMMSKASSFMPSLMIAKVKSQPKRSSQRLTANTQRPSSGCKTQQTFDEMVKT